MCIFVIRLSGSIFYGKKLPKNFLFWCKHQWHQVKGLIEEMTQDQGLSGLDDDSGKSWCMFHPYHVHRFCDYDVYRNHIVIIWPLRSQACCWGIIVWECPICGGWTLCLVVTRLVNQSMLARVLVIKFCSHFFFPSLSSFLLVTFCWCQYLRGIHHGRSH